eukprot:scaffold951_cov431-Prasinococcus_capsulatus_cf.AAC.5
MALKAPMNPVKVSTVAGVFGINGRAAVHTPAPRNENVKRMKEARRPYWASYCASYTFQRIGKRIVSIARQQNVLRERNDVETARQVKAKVCASSILGIPAAATESAAMEESRPR